ncbi:hypothetical protein [Formosa algae]|uniref:ABC-type enterobactin transport system permease subunit n=1 Tax=Formosa algae TaxID=225843 RepID=A0A9X0YLH5_9FLAO|nr:hypothetical protein [Formosa algae]MBP1840791.1 ABC-type enterobactin transport system permease subunit [Formosa algae]MDQ0336312.1 ABC-type enterobactin transport system permease subunit [Formosa algae]OEI80338.1 hypothetical protein AST99_09985 [Formosa algae]
MEQRVVIAITILVFLIVLFFYWKLTVGRYKSENSERMRKLWGKRTYYWEGLIYGSTFITFLIMCILRWTKVLHF